MSSLWYPSVKQAPMSMGGMGGVVGSYNFRSAGSSECGPASGSVFYNADENLHVSGGAMQVYNFDSNNSFCVEAFIKMDTMSRWNYVALRWDGSSNYNRIWRFGVSSNNLLTFQGNISCTQSSQNMTTDTWYHVAAVREGSTQGYSNYLRLYVNGVDVGNNSGSGSSMESNYTPISIGANAESTNYSMRGYISNLRITVNEPVYTTAFDPPTCTLTTTSQGVTESNVRLLCCQSTSDVTASTHLQAGTISIDNGAPTASSTQPF